MRAPIVPRPTPAKPSAEPAAPATSEGPGYDPRHRLPSMQKSRQMGIRRAARHLLFALPLLGCGGAVPLLASFSSLEGGEPGSCGGVDACLQSCDSGKGAACTRLGLAHEFVLQLRDSVKSVDFLRRGCDLNDARGCLWLGLMYESSSAPFPKDSARAATLFVRACDGGNAVGCFRLGWSFRDGRGIAKDDRRAIELFGQACEGGVASGCVFLSDMQPDHAIPLPLAEKAATVYRSFCDGPRRFSAGEAPACTALATLYEQGRGVAREPSLARAYLQKGCNRGEAEACSRLERTTN